MPGLKGRALTFSILIGIALGVLYVHELTRHSATRQELDQARMRVKQLEVRPNSWREAVSSVSAAPRVPTTPAVPEPAAIVETVPEETQKAEAQQRSPMYPRAQEWRTEVRLNQISEFTALTEEQRERLKEKYWAEAAGSTDTESLADILGEELAAEFEAERERLRETRRARRVDNEVYRLSRTLSLSADQEEETKVIVSEVNDEVREIAREMLPFERAHNPDEINPREAMQTMKDLQDTRRNMINERLRDVLSDDQYNKLLEDQATAPPRRWFAIN